jgi:predicted phosphodiesterase
MSLRRILFVPDTHRPYHDPRAWALMLRAGKAFQPDHVVVLGDFADCYTVSQHPKDPRRRTRFAEEVADVNAGLDELETLKADRYDFIEGNHEFRFARYLEGTAPALSGLRGLSIPEMYRLKPRGWRFTPYRQHAQIGKLFITHETGDAGSDAHRKAQRDFTDNVVIGHTHRTGYAIIGNAKGMPHVGAMFGWLGSVERIDYAHRIKALRDWNHGFGLGYMEPDGAIHLRPIPIVRERCVVDGELVRLP